MIFIMEIHEIRRCERCGQRYPLKREILKYLFWEIRFLYLTSSWLRQYARRAPGVR